jgi:hypothetical protein
MTDLPTELTPDEQLRRWVAGDSLCPSTSRECCPDFSCCSPHLKWDEAKRIKFRDADEGTKHKMLMGSLGALLASANVKAHITRGEPTDND